MDDDDNGPGLWIKRPKKTASRRNVKSASYNGSSAPSGEEINDEAAEPAVVTVAKPKNRRTTTLQSLRGPSSSSSTPSTSHAQNAFTPTSDALSGAESQPESRPNSAANVLAKFGNTVSTTSNLANEIRIPTQNEIDLKKAQRSQKANLAKYGVSVEDGSDEDEGSRTGVGKLVVDDTDSEDEFKGQKDWLGVQKIDEKASESRMQADDENFMEVENFDEPLVTSGRINVDFGTEDDQRRKVQDDIRARLADAQNENSDADSDDSQAMLEKNYDITQTAKALGNTSLTSEEDRDGVKRPAKIAPIPTLAEIKERLLAKVQGFEESKARTLQHIEDVTREKNSLLEREVYLKEQLAEAARKLQESQSAIAA